MAYSFELNIALSVFIISSAIALILIQLQKKTNLPGDALLGLLAHSSLAVGLVGNWISNLYSFRYYGSFIWRYLSCNNN
jgi:zinc transport system permease protein